MYVDAYLENQGEGFDPKIVIAIRKHADAMIKWQQTHPDKVKVADMKQEDMVY